MRVLVDVFFAAKDRTFGGEQLDDAFVALEDMLADELGQTALGGELALGIDRRKDVEPVLAAGLVIVCAMTGGDVDRAGAGVVGDEEGVDDLRSAREEGMLREAAIERAAFELVIGMAGVERETGGGGKGLET